MKAKWIPEKYPPSGTIGAAGFYKLLGRPQLDPLTVLVRETAQNSWDAKRPRAQSVRFSMHGRDLDDHERTALLGSLLTERERAMGTGLSELTGLFTALFITDRGTLGLGGPVSASEVSENRVYDWVDFVLNVGKTNTAGHTGGTYGFGKTIAYVVSAVNTVVVYSRAKHGGVLQSRLMACAIGSEFSHNGELYTGRHWWGAEPGHAPVPLVGAEADELAGELGMPSFDGSETGTTLMIVQPDFGGRTPEQGMRFIVEAALWNLWPKLVERSDLAAEMSVTFSWNGVSIPLPSVESRPPLGGFVQAFQGLNSNLAIEELSPGLRRDSIGLEKPRKIVGELVTVPMTFRERANIDDGSSIDDPDAPRSAAMIEGPAHHVALIRSPNLVVEYLEGPPSPEGSFEWAGVFKAADSEDHVFALAEPPTHDTWRPELLGDRAQKSVVKMALQNIRKVLEHRWGSRASVGSTPSSSTSVIAQKLSHLVAGSLGTAAAPSEAAGGGGGGKRRGTGARLQVVSSGPLDHNSELRTQMTILVTPAAGAARTGLRASIGIALAGGGVDQTVDEGLGFVSVNIGGSTVLGQGRDARVVVVGNEPTEVQLIARRTTDFSIAFDVEIYEVDRNVQ